MKRKDLFGCFVVEQADVDPREIEVVEATARNEFINPTFQRPVYIKPTKTPTHFLLVQECLLELHYISAAEES